ncbi:MAG: hypothetical protein K2P86_14640 [Xanthobacteraceae bacterium]|nr:hypothetical protein [Xanthobacteraceae bacterium]
MAKKRNAPARQSAWKIFKGWLESAAVIGAVQVAALLVGILALLWSIFGTGVTPAQAEGRQPTDTAVIAASLIAEDLTHLQKLHAAVDDVAKYPPEHSKFQEAESVIDSFMVAREEVLKRYQLVELYQAFFKRLEEFGSTPTLPNRLLLRQEARRFGAALDAARQQMARTARR